ncbi:lipopolysaccharide biosynthesis protein [Paucisalibacillus sp. EB02]|uniref:lipopolysaccharide biosynthesis protein n=1 Tax=Paucisalibacillus sp. EB02 TaxID=1347087 RepID=UPI0006932CB6|nr:oligosaccharide flippase family protein [Paucisalibacillus sp. EB02]
MVIKKLSLKTNMTWTLAGTIIYSLTQWLLLIVIAKLGTPEMVGKYALGLAVTAPIIMLTEMRLRLTLITDAKGSYGFHHYLGTRIVSVLISFLIIIAIVLVIGYEFQTSMIIILIGIAKLPESVSDILHGKLHKYERMDFINISSVLKGILTVIVFSWILYTTNSLMMAIIGQILVWTVILLFFDCLIAKRYGSIKPSFNVTKMKQLVKLTIPLGIMGLLTTVNTNLPSYLVEYFLGKEELGYFVALFYILLAGNRVVNALRQPAAPLLASLYEEGNLKGFNNLLLKLLGIGAIIGVLGLITTYIFGEFLLSIIYTPSYAAYSGLFVAIMVSGLFSYPAAFLANGVIATRHFKSQPYLAGLWVLTSVIGCIVFIPKLGVYGAAIAVIIASFVELISLYLVLVRIIKNDRNSTDHHNENASLVKKVMY